MLRGVGVVDLEFLHMLIINRFQSAQVFDGVFSARERISFSSSSSCFLLR
jgi:hypothetical protein